MTSAVSLFSVNPLLNTDKRIFLWNTDRLAKKLFVELCSLNIEVQGFVESQPEIDSFFNKPVYQYSKIDDSDLVITLEESDQKEYINVQYCNPVVLNHSFSLQKIVIYGAGEVGRRLKKYLEQKGYEILGFIDTNYKIVGTYIDGSRVFSQDDLRKFDNIVLIEAGKYWREIDKIVCNINSNLKRYYIENNFFLEIMENDHTIIVDYEMSQTLEVNHTLVQLAEQFSNKTIILFDDDITFVKKYQKTFRLLGYKKIKVTSDINKINEEEFLVENCVYREKNENFIILIRTKKNAQYLLKKGFLEGIHFTSIDYPSIDYYFYKTMKLDVMLGYTYTLKQDSKCDGYFIYGNNRISDYKILILGGSNTETNRTPFPCWVEIMFNNYLKEKNVTIFNGAISGYTSSQEVMKLLRDIDRIKPNLVLSYGGYNNLYQYVEKSNRPFHIAISQKIFLQYAKKEELEMANELFDNGNEDVFECWVKHMKYLHAISMINESDFCAFVQPFIYTKKCMNRHEKRLVKMLNTIFSNEMINKCKEYISMAEKASKEYNYIFNFTSILEQKDVYMDICHVNKEGNMIIAEKVWMVVKERMQLMKAKN